jgi:hypothetical protein
MDMQEQHCGDSRSRLAISYTNKVVQESRTPIYSAQVNSNMCKGSTIQIDLIFMIKLRVQMKHD